MINGEETTVPDEEEISWVVYLVILLIIIFVVIFDGTDGFGTGLMIGSILGSSGSSGGSSGSSGFGGHSSGGGASRHF